MRKGALLDPFLFFSLSVSIFGLITVLMLALWPPRFHESSSWRKPLIGSISSLICVGGIVAAFFPKACKAESDLRRSKTPVRPGLARRDRKKASQGHHPNCGKFSANTIEVKGSVLCAACTGLLIGAILSLIGTAFYFFVGWQSDRSGLSMVLLGQAGIVLGFLQFRFKGYFRSGVNTLFVLSSFLVLIGIDALSENLLTGLYTLMLVGFWLFTRILISKRNNRRICSTCLSCELEPTVLSASTVQSANNYQYSEDYYRERPNFYRLRD
jgi:hypothetical protein